MKKIKRLLVFILVFSLLVPIQGFADGWDDNAKKSNEFMSVLKRDAEPRKSAKEMKEQYQNPADYPLKNEGEFVGRLVDSKHIYHDITFNQVADYSNDFMQLSLLYQSGNAYMKDRYLRVELWTDAGGKMQYAGYLDFDTWGHSKSTLNGNLPKSHFADQKYLYLRAGVFGDPIDEYYSDVTIFKVVNPFYSGGQQPSEGNKYALISNESVVADQTQFTGAFSINNEKYTMNKKMGKAAYQLDVNRPFDTEKHADKKLERRPASKRSLNRVGDTKSFWAYDFATDRDYQIEAKLLYTGTKTNVWVHNHQITSTNAQKLGQEFDQKIHPSVTQNFANESDVDGNGKVHILCFDIQDGFTGYGGYIAGYFYGGDLFDVEGSNRSEIFYIDTYPSMGMGTIKNVDAAYGTLAHEFQHMVNFNQNVFVEGGLPMDTWLNEGLSMAAEQVYSGKMLTDRIDYYNSSSSITNGHSLLHWDDDGDTLSNYSLSYLFGQYVRTQAGRGNGIFKEILADTNNDYRAVENAAKKYMDPSITFGKLMTNFRGALLLKQKTGVYGFKGEPGFDAIQPKVFTRSSAYLRGGGAVVKKAAENETIPAAKGKDVTYTFFDLDKKDPGDVTPPSKPLVEPVGDQNTAVYGLSEPGATVYVQRNASTIGSGTTDDLGAFKVPIPKQKAGTVLTIFAKDRAGNRSEAVKITVIDKTPPGVPIVNEVGDSDKVVTGTAEAGSTIRVEKAGSKLGNAKTGADGKFSVPLPSAQKAGTVLYVTATDPAGNLSPAKKVTVVDKTPPKAPTINPVSDKDQRVTGTAEAGSTISVKSGNTKLGTAKSGSDGKFSVSLPSIQKADTVLSVTATDKAGNESPASKVTVLDRTAPNAPIVSPVSNKDKAVKGTAEGGSSVTVKAGSKVLNSSKAGADGKFTVTLSSVQKAGTVLSVTATDKAGNVSPAKKITVIDKTPPAIPTVSPVSDRDKKVTGKAETGSKVTVKAGSKVLNNATANKNGKYAVSLKSTQKAGTVLYVTATDNAGNVSKARKVTVVDKTAPAVPKVNKVTVKSTAVKGKAEANSTVYVKAGKKVIGSAKANKSGNFSVKIKKQKAGTVLQVYAKDKAGNTGKAAKVTVKKK